MLGAIRWIIIIEGLETLTKYQLVSDPLPAAVARARPQLAVICWRGWDTAVASMASVTMARVTTSEANTVVHQWRRLEIENSKHWVMTALKQFYTGPDVFVKCKWRQINFLLGKYFVKIFTVVVICPPCLPLSRCEPGARLELTSPHENSPIWKYETS